MSAIAAIKGYRTQFLYSLYRIVSDKNTDYRYHLEGNYEDLDILDQNGNYIECLQVKNIEDTLSFSNLFSKTDSFFDRAIKAISENHEVKVKIVSYGKISSELTNATTLCKKLKDKCFLGKHYKPVDIKLILDHYSTPEQIEEKNIYNAILSELKHLYPFMDVAVVIEFLLMRMFILAEQQIATTYNSLNNDIERIGTFIAEREDFHTEFARTIIPLSNKSVGDENIDILKSEYYFGASAKYEHILADLDIAREQKVDEIKAAFERNNIVFIHGASGQGKSTLAYRFLYNQLLDGTVYELKLSDNFNEVYKTINSLNSLCKGLSVPITIYIDVLPANQYWNEVLKELSTKTNLKFLITLRQETWNATTLGVDYAYCDVELLFNEREAEDLYQSLCFYKEDLKFVSFQESWRLFGKKGSLLEYVYFINQGDKLKLRLAEQVRQLQNREKINELKILRYIALADSFDAKIDYLKLLSSLGIDVELANKYIKELEKEYLLRFSEDEKFIIGLHSVRSKLLFEILFDENEYVNFADYVPKALFVIDESDIHSFLLHSFYNGYEVESLISILNSSEWKLSYIGIKNTLQAFIWKGIYDFVFVHNYDALNKLFNLHGSGWCIGMPYFYTNEIQQPIYESLKDQMESEKLKSFRGIASEFSDKEILYTYAKRFINNLRYENNTLLSTKDVPSIGYVLFWAGHLKCNLDVRNISERILTQSAETLSIDALSELILGLMESSFNDAIIKQLQEIAVLKIRDKYSITFLSVGNELECEYLLNLITLERNAKEINDASNLYNTISVRILELFRMVFPNCSKYKARCIGQKTINDMLGLENNNDFSLKMIPQSNLPIKHTIIVNKLIVNLFNYHNKPNRWSDYIDKILDVRYTYCNIMSDLLSSFTALSKHKDVTKLDDLCIKISQINQVDPVFTTPKVISDKWGYGIDLSNDNIIQQNIQLGSESVISPYNLVGKLQQDYLSSITTDALK